jgi:SSS family solute:Na+ symporter
VDFNSLDIAVFAAFVLGVVGFAMYKSRSKGGSEDYFLAGRGLPWPVIGLSIVAANISTEQMVGMAGQGAGGTGLAVSLWQLTGSVGIVIIAFTLMPRFLRAGIYTIPEFLEYRYNSLARGIMAVLTVVIYVGVLLAGVLYSGALTLKTIFEMDLTTGVWLMGVIAAIYTTWGGLKAVAYADLLLGIALLLGGALVFGLGLHAIGGWEPFATGSADRLHMILPAEHADLPWTGVLSGMWIVILYYCGLNQFIVQRNLAARSLHDGQMGMVFAGALWLLVPFVIVMPGIMACQLFPEEVARNPDKAFPFMIREVVPAGLRAFILAAIAGAIISSLASMINSASTIATLDVYQRLIHRGATQKQLVLLGRVLTVVFVAIGCLVAPQLADPKFGGVFTYIQQFQGYIWPGVVAAFVMAFVLPRAPGPAGVAALVSGPVIYGLLQKYSQIHFLIQVLIAFVACCLIMIGIRMAKPLSEPRVLPDRPEMHTGNSPMAMAVGAVVIVCVIGLVIWFR